MSYQPQQKPYVTPAVKTWEHKKATELYVKRVKIDRHNEDKALRDALREVWE